MISFTLQTLAQRLLARVVATIPVLECLFIVQPTEATHPNRAAFPASLSGPALRALATAGIQSMLDLESWTERDLATLHGMGPRGIRILREALAASGRVFRQP